MKEKVKIYVCSINVSTLDYVDKESIGHPCVTSQHSENVFTQFKHFPGASGLLTENQKEIIDRTIEFCKENDLEYEIIDLANLSFLRKMKVTLKGIKAPVIEYKGKKIEGVQIREDLETLFFQ